MCVCVYFCVHTQTKKLARDVHLQLGDLDMVSPSDWREEGRGSVCVYVCVCVCVGGGD